MLVTSIFSFSYNVFESFFSHILWKRNLNAAERAENIVVKGENAGDQHFSFSHNVF